jgi:hypothetical protein
MKQMQINFAESLFETITAAEIESNWAKIEYTSNGDYCKLAMYVSTIEYDQAELNTACAAVAGCVFDPLAYTEFAVALHFKDITASGACYGADKKSLGVGLTHGWKDVANPYDVNAGFHMVFDNGFLTEFFNCDVYRKNSGNTCNSVVIPPDNSYWKMCSDDGSFFNEGNMLARF